MNDKFIKAKKYIVVALFLIASLLSVWLMGKVVINYNISDYLDEDTETKISLNIIEDEFEQTGDIQVMIEDIDKESAKNVRDTIKGISNVLTVNFNEYDENYYKDGNALFVVLVDGDEYSDTANVVVEDIKKALDDSFEGKTNYGGAVVNKRIMRETIQKEVVLILAISLCLVVAIMLIMAKSWLEPIILLLASGVAVLINMGTNAIFGEISYITNAVAAILQLALSVDYSIVLLHGYRKAKESESSSEKAMLCAIKNVVKPVSASALTTIAGLLALLFMTMTIGFDIGIVLMKGIFISALTSLLLLPALLLVFEKLMDKTAKKELILKGRKLSYFAVKGGKTVIPIALALIIVCGALQFGNSYSFTDSSGLSTAISDKFGSNNTVVVVYPNREDNNERESALATRLAKFKTSDGKVALKSYTAYSNTVRELYDIETAARKLDISEADVEMLFTMYHLYNNKSAVKLSSIDFVKYAEQLATTDADVKEFTDAQTLKTLRTLLVINEIMTGNHTADELHTLATTGAMEGTNLSLFAVKQMYGLYSYNKIANKKVSIKEIVSFASEAATNGSLGNLVDTQTAESLDALSSGIEQFEEEMNKPMTKSEFKQYMLTEQGVELGDSQIALLYSSYFAHKNGVEEETVPFLSLMNYLVESGQITDAETIAGIAQLNELHALDVAAFRAQMDKEMSVSAFKQYLATEFGVVLSDFEVLAIFLGYSSQQGTSVQGTIPFLPLMTYLAQSGYVTDPEAVAQIERLNVLYNSDLEEMKAQLNKTMTAEQLRAHLSTEFGVELDASQVKLIYSAYFGDKNEIVGDTVPFLSLMNYLVYAEQVTDPDAITTINGCNELLAAIPNDYAYDELLPLFNSIIKTLTGETVELGFDELAIQQIYIMYFYDKGTIPTEEILGKDFFDLVMKTAQSNAVVKAQLSEDTMLKLQDLYAVHDFMSNKTAYDFSKMTERITLLQKKITSISASNRLGEGTISGLYIKYAINEGTQLCEPIVACDMLDFVINNMDTNELLKAKITEEKREKVELAKVAINDATDLFFGDNYSRMLLSIDLPNESEDSTKFVEYLSTSVKKIFGKNAHVAGEMIATVDLQQSFDTDNTIISIFTIVSIFLIVMIVFRSLSLPIILVTVIQGAIWICMSTSLLSGPMFFMSYIIANCILMGATIDYGILMSTSYVQYRQTFDRKVSLIRSVEAAIPTVFTSGLILTICGFVVGFISTQTSISTVGFLLGKGTLVSVLMITLVLPAILYVLDGFILKLSMKKKNNK